jgi:hypothetical protein
MKSKTGINAQVDKDLEYIPRGIKGSAQNIFRLYYSDLRRHDLAETSKTKNETLKQAADNVKKEHPDFVPKYDHDYFQLTNS